MCGIVAFYDPKINEKQAVIGKMMATIKHRGPSSDGYYTNDEVALGFRRLSIIDLRGGTQPIYNEHRKSWSIGCHIGKPRFLHTVL